jgi:hypothetical protein
MDELIAPRIHAVLALAPDASRDGAPARAALAEMRA